MIGETLNNMGKGDPDGHISAFFAMTIIHALKIPLKGINALFVMIITGM